MDIYEVLIVNAFTHQGQGGNPAGVVTQADSLTTQQKQLIAKEMALSETAFVSSSQQATHQVEFFTPTSQVPLCGHATIATWTTLSQKLNYKPGVYTQRLLSGILEIQVLPDGSVVMEQEKPIFGKHIEIDELAPLFGLSPEAFLRDVAPQLVSTGLFDVMVGVKSVEALERIRPNFEAIVAFQQAHQEAGIHVFALTPDSKKAVSRNRNFCPLLGIPEESATGSSSGALLCYLFKNCLLNKNQVTKGIWSEQGFGMNQPSDLFGRLTIGNNKTIEKVEIGGKATIVGSKKIQI